MDRSTSALDAVLAPACQRLDVELYDVELGPRSLLVTVWREGGLDLDALAGVAKSLSAALDEHDDLAPLERYELEVSTPGLERRLRLARHFAAAIGSDVALRLVAGVAGQRRIEGRLLAADELGIELAASSGATRLGYDEIERAHTIFDWKGALASPAAGQRGPSEKSDKIKERA